jgi:hypothetical protein
LYNLFTNLYTSSNLETLHVPLSVVHKIVQNISLFFSEWN